MRVLPLLPDDKEALTKDARVCLRNTIGPMQLRGKITEMTSEMFADIAFYADFQIVVVRYFTRTCDATLCLPFGTCRSPTLFRRRQAGSGRGPRRAFGL